MDLDELIIAATDPREPDVSPLPAPPRRDADVSPLPVDVTEAKRAQALADKPPKNPYQRAKLALAPTDKPARLGQLEVVPTEAELASDRHVCRGGATCRDKNGLLKPGHARGVERRHFNVGWRAELAAEVGNSGEKLWPILLRIARGIPTEIKDGKGRETTIVPTAGDQLRSAIELAHMLVGKPVTQSEILASEKASADLAAVRGLSDDELKRRVAKLLVEGAVDAEVEIPEVQDDEEDDGIA